MQVVTRVLRNDWPQRWPDALSAIRWAEHWSTHSPSLCISFDSTLFRFPHLGLFSWGLLHKCKSFFFFHTLMSDQHIPIDSQCSPPPPLGRQRTSAIRRHAV